MESMVATTNAATIEVEGKQNKQTSVYALDNVVVQGNGGEARLLTNFSVLGGRCGCSDTPRFAEKIKTCPIDMHL